MDLKEINQGSCRRHPWETARLSALQEILAPRLFEGMSILDLGCGDGYVSRGLFASLGEKNVTAVDINLSEEMLLKLSAESGAIAFRTDMPEGAFDLVLLLDVIEHVEEDKTLLSHVVEKHLLAKGKIMITVPAFQCIYSGHDAYLGHYRRYSLKQLTELSSRCGLDVVSSGYLFSLLLLPKVVLYKLLKRGSASEGVGNWRGGAVVTSLLHALLRTDNKVLTLFSRMGVKIPGLTAWVLCEKR